MSAKSCPACGLQQTLASPRCARCGALLAGAAPAPFVFPAAAGVDDRTVLRHSLPLPPDSIPQPDATAVMPDQNGSHDAAPGRPDPTWRPGHRPSAPTHPGRWRRFWTRLTNGPQEPTAAPHGDAPRE